MMLNRKVASGWRLGPSGDLSTIDDRGMILAAVSSCYGYSNQGSNGSRGCELWEQPQCRNRDQTFDLVSGLFRHANETPAVRVSDNNSSLGLSDCREACWRWSGCECAGYGNYQGLDYGCSYWIGKDLKWDQDLEGSMERIYVLQSSGTGEKKNNKYVGIILGVLSAVVLLILGLAYLIKRNREGKREEELHQLLTLDGYTGSNFDRGPNNHHLKLFTHASILSATTNFSLNNKLGEGGFGPVYKVKSLRIQKSGFLSLQSIQEGAIRLAETVQHHRGDCSRGSN